MASLDRRILYFCFIFLISVELGPTWGWLDRGSPDSCDNWPAGALDRQEIRSRSAHRQLRSFNYFRTTFANRSVWASSTSNLLSNRFCRCTCSDCSNFYLLAGLLVHDKTKALIKEPMKKSRNISLILFLTLSTLSLCGCGGSEEDTKATLSNTHQMMVSLVDDVVVKGRSVLSAGFRSESTNN